MTKTNQILGTLAIAGLLGACGSVAQAPVSSLDESQITAKITCAADNVRAAVSPADGGRLAPAAAPVDSAPADGGRLAPAAAPVDSAPADGGRLAPAAAPVDSAPADGGRLAPVTLTLALSSSLECVSYNVEVTGTDVDADAISIEGSGTDVSVTVKDGAFAYEFITSTLENLELAI